MRKLSPIALSAFVLLMTGCATYSQMFVNANGQIQRCSSTGQGVIGMAVASNSVDQCGKDMLAAGYLPMDRAGVVGVVMSEAVADTVRVLRITTGSPADSAGFQAGDVVVRVAGQPVRSPGDARSLMFGEAGTTVEVTMRRADQDVTRTVTRAPYRQVFGTPAAAPAASSGARPPAGY